MAACTAGLYRLLLRQCSNLQLKVVFTLSDLSNELTQLLIRSKCEHVLCLFKHFYIWQIGRLQSVSSEIDHH